MEFHHKSVLFEESIDALNLTGTEVILDGTAGGGGHSAEIARRIPDGKLICVDQDPDAIEVLGERMKAFPNAVVIQDNFVNIKNIILRAGVEKLDGVLLDLGVSSHQLDVGERGFSFHSDAPLDMRMSQSGLSAKEVVNTYSFEALASVIRRYGEEKFAGSIARNIVKQRETHPIETTGELVEIIRNSMPAAARRDTHPARRTFQAIRIEVNGELDKLSEGLDNAFDCLNTGGRIAVITFHSLEDRIVKERFRQWCTGCTCPKEFPVCVCGKTPRGKLPFKAKAPTVQELENNPRARSSRLRVIEKIK